MHYSERIVSSQQRSRWAVGNRAPTAAVYRKVRSGVRSRKGTKKHREGALMIRLTTQVEDRELVAAIHALGRDRVKRFVRLLLLYKDDQLLLEECADMVLEELERRASSNPQR